MPGSVCARGSPTPRRGRTVRGAAPDPCPSGAVVARGRVRPRPGERTRDPSPLQHDERGGHVVGVGERQVDAPDAAPGGEPGGAAVEPDAGAAGRLAEDLDLGPAAALPAVAGPDRLEE